MDDKKTEQSIRLIQILKYMREEGIQKGKGNEEKVTATEKTNNRHMFTDATIERLAPQAIKKSQNEQGFEPGE